MDYGIMECFHSHPTFPTHSHFPSSFRKATCQAAIMVESHHFPSQPDVYPSISIGPGTVRAPTHSHSHFGSVWAASICTSLLAWLQPQCLCCALASGRQWNRRAVAFAAAAWRAAAATPVTHTAANTRSHASTLAPDMAGWWKIM